GVAEVHRGVAHGGGVVLLGVLLGGGGNSGVVLVLVFIGAVQQRLEVAGDVVVRKAAGQRAAHQSQAQRRGGQPQGSPFHSISHVTPSLAAHSLRPQHFLYFRPLPQGQGSLRPGFFCLCTGCFCTVL